MGLAEVRSGLSRFEENGLGVYVWPDGPDWCVPNARGDFILRRLAEGMSRCEVTEAYAGRFGVDTETAAVHVQQFARRVARPAARPYEGRAAHLSLGRLRECWLHVSNRCNAACTHCMFRSSPADATELSPETVMEVVDEASRLGCELFYFTGGEPLIYPALPGLCDRILATTPAHVVLLTNAMASTRFLAMAADWDPERVHLQVSVDGGEASHDALRGPGSYRLLMGNLRLLIGAGFPVTLAMAVHSGNVGEMADLVDLAAELGVGNLHYLWLFTRGNAKPELFVPPDEIWPHLRAAAERADARGVLVDNVEILKSQVFSIPGTRFDLSNAGWESLAVGPDGFLYPSPALVCNPDAVCGTVAEGIEDAWQTGPRFEELRACSIATAPEYQANPWRFLVGGGDVDHSLSHGGAFAGHDPYVPLYNRIARWLIAREAARFPERDVPGFRLAMGEWLYECGAEGDGVFFTHSNCVLSLPGRDGHAFARDFYAQAAETPNETILNPVQYADAEIAFIPQEARVRSYGCGSPVADAMLKPGETVADLGCGTGVECFVAASLVGPTGRVVGIDMLPEMLARAEAAAPKVAERLGYANVIFHRSLLEELPLESESADVVVSNCVINLSPHKREAFSEMLRVLRPGGRIVISDVVSEGDIPIAIQYSEKLRGECLGGALRRDRLFGLLADVGFIQATIVKRFPYREVRGHPFHSVTYAAVKPPAGAWKTVLYRGPFAAAVTDDGRVLARGEHAELPWQEGLPLDATAFVLDDGGWVTNVEQEACCSCATAPEQAVAADASACCGPDPARHGADCMVCGEPLVYLDRERGAACHYCGETATANATCAAGHFVCDACHSKDALAVIERICLHSAERDMVALLRRIREHPDIPLHGPEHHALVPAVIVTACRNAGGDVADVDIPRAIQRGATIAGGSCAFLGICGAASGVGTAFSLLLGANPLKGSERQAAQRATLRALAEIARVRAARCCQRDCYLALRVAAQLSKDLLPIPLTADAPLPCTQHAQNADCIGRACPLWPQAQASSSSCCAAETGGRTC